MTKRLRKICCYIIKLKPDISNLYLQKLLYLIQAASIYYLKRPAFEDKIEAWVYGTCCS